VKVVELDYPFTGLWAARNSPANRVPSHGTRLFGSSYAIDFVPVDGDGRSAPITLESLLRSEPPQRFAGFGRAVLAPTHGVVVAISDGEPDHHARRGLPSIGYALTQRSRASHGWPHLAGNHVFIDSDGTYIALCHLQRNSISVQVGMEVRRGDHVARCGNSGNSTEPHLHVQAVDSLNIADANAVPITFRGGIPRNGEIITGSAR